MQTGFQLALAGKRHASCRQEQAGSQSAFFDFCVGNRHRIVAGARVKAVKLKPKLLVARMEVAKVAQLIGFSRKCGTNYTLCCGLARVRVESDKMVPKIRLSPQFGACAGGSSENGVGNIFPAHYKECSLGWKGLHRNFIFTLAPETWNFGNKKMKSKKSTCTQ